jgi:hypothetical protein
VRVFIVLVLLGQAPAPELMTPEGVWSAAYLDLYDKTEPADRRYTRYLYAPDNSAAYPQIVDLAANSTSFRGTLAHVDPIGRRILKLDLRAFAWDYASRTKRLAELERRGVKFDFKDANERREFLDPWEKLARADPYFVADHYDSGGGYRKGWIERDKVNAARQLTYSLKFVLRADWVLPRLLLEEKLDGIYSTLLMIPKLEDQFYRSLLIDIKAYERDNYLIKGGAVQGGGPVGVSLNNRELQLFNGPYGYYYRTFDVNVDARGNKSVLEATKGTLDHDGREAFGQLPNHMLWWRLDNGDGVQAAEVPPEIAQVKESPAGLPIRDTRVLTAYQCFRCHLPNNGIYPFEDIVRKAFLSKQAVLNVKAKNPYAASELATAIADYYDEEMPKTIKRQQEDFAAVLKSACGMTGPEAAHEIVGAIETYLHDTVSPGAAAREMGYPPDQANIAWLGASLPYSYGGVHYEGNPQLAVLASGQPLKRAAWEQSFGDAMRMAIEMKRRLGMRPKNLPD